MTNVDCPTPLLRDEKLVSGDTPAPGTALNPSASATLLLAEDDPAVRGFMGAILKQAGYRVLLAENGRKSLELCKTHSGAIQALITDVVMPETNGRELAEQAKLIRPDLKVLFVSGYVDRGLKEENADNPSYAFLEKPFTAETLLEKVAQFCPAPRPL